MLLTVVLAASVEARPHVIVVLADDLGVGDLSCYGSGKIRTPHVDRLAAEGVRFTDAHSSSAVCTPSRYALLTGRYPWRAGAREGVLSSFGGPLIDPARPTIAPFLREEGYATAAVGKWHLGLQWQPKPWIRLDTSLHDAKGTVDYTKPFRGGPTQLGFDYFYGMAASLDMPPYCFLENVRVVSFPEEVQPAENLPRRGRIREGPRTSDWSFEEVDLRHWEVAARWIRDRQVTEPERPFFLYLALSAPHSPYYFPGEVAGRSGVGERGDLVLAVDLIVGRLLGLLDELQLRRETVVIFTSDNGAPLEPWESEAGHAANGKWRGEKGMLFEGGHRVPLVVSWPGRLPECAVSESLVSNQDIFATLADILKKPLPNVVEDSVSFLAALKQPEIKSGRPPLVHHSFTGRLAVRSERWKLLASLDPGGFADRDWKLPEKGGPEGMLFDLENDPGETTNLWLERPEIVAELRNLLEQAVAGEPRARGRTLFGTPSDGL